VENKNRKLKIIYLFQAIPHYYNHVLSRLNDLPYFEIIDVIPKETKHVGAGVYQTKEDSNFKIIKLDEIETTHGQFFQGLFKVIIKERPDIIVTVRNHLEGIKDKRWFYVFIRLLGIKLILKDHPFRLPTAEELLLSMEKEDASKPVLTGIEWLLYPLFKKKLFRKELLPSDLLAIYRSASELESKGMNSEATALFNKVIEKDQTHNRKLSAGAYYHLSQLAEGEVKKTMLKKCFSRDPSNSKAFKTLKPNIYPFFECLAKLAKKYYRAKTLKRFQKLFNMPDAHVHYVETGRNILKTYGVPQERIFLTYNSPDTEMLFKVKDKLLNETQPPQKKIQRIVHTGRLVEWKRVDLLIKAVAKLKDKFNQIELLVIGYGPEEERLKKLAEEEKVNERISFLGGIYNPYELGKLYLSSSVYVLAGMGGISINEAMCFGLPIILSVCDGTEKHLVFNGQNGFYFEEGNLDDLCAKISKILSEPKLSHEMGRESERIIREQINIHTVIKGYTEAFRFVMK